MTISVNVCLYANALCLATVSPFFICCPNFKHRLEASEKLYERHCSQTPTKHEQKMASTLNSLKKIHMVTMVHDFNTVQRIVESTKQSHVS